MTLSHRRSRWFVVQAFFSCWLAVLLATVPLALAGRTPIQQLGLLRATE